MGGASHEPQAARSTERAGLTMHVGAKLRSTTGILVAIPLMVAVLGVSLTLLGRSALRSSNSRLAEERFLGQTDAVARSIDASLADATPIRARLADLAAHWQPSDDPKSHAYALGDLLTAHPGVSWLTVSFPNGFTAGVYFDGPDKALRFLESEYRGPGDTIERRYDLSTRDSLRLVSTDPSKYDPRTRPFWALAESHDGPAFTEPYTFAKTFETGITLAEAVRKGGFVHAVITVDFDIVTLSQMLARAEVPDAAIILLSAPNGSILALPHLRERYPSLVFPADRPLEARDFGDPVLAEMLSASAPTDRGVRAFHANGGGYLAARTPAATDARLGWLVTVAVPEAQFLGTIDRYANAGLVASAAAVGVAVLLSLLFARHITRARAAVVVAEAKVVRAEEKVAEAEEKLQQASGALRDLGSYRLVERLARGGMGELWRAEHRLLARPAAVKLITLEEGVTDEDARVASERFRREAKTLASLEARNTVQVFDYGAAEDGTLFLVMELLRGVDLERLVAEQGPQPASRVVSILVQALSSLDEAHRAGLVHRDIKPANLFLSRVASEVDVVKVVDFGLVRLREESEPALDARASVAPAVDPIAAQNVASAALTSKQGVLGTPACMAPEQVRNQAVDGRTDLYAIGCVGFYLLTGEHVFGSSNAMATLVAHMTKKPRKPSVVGKTPIPDALEQAILACLEKDPAKRPSSAADLAATLRAVPIDPEDEWTDARAAAWWAERDARVIADAADEAKLAAATTVDQDPGSKQLVVAAR